MKLSLSGMRALTIEDMRVLGMGYSGGAETKVSTAVLGCPGDD